MTATDRMCPYCLASPLGPHADDCPTGRMDRIAGQIRPLHAVVPPHPEAERKMLANALIGWVVTLGNSAALGANLTDDGLRDEWHRLVDQCEAFLIEERGDEQRR